MATGPEHYRLAEDLLACDGPLTAEVIGAAQVHATLALAVATAPAGWRPTPGTRWRESGSRIRRCRADWPGKRKAGRLAAAGSRAR